MVEDKSAGSPQEPLFVAMTEEELEAKFGATREAGRVSAAKGAGFESVEELEEALGAIKAGGSPAKLAEAGDRLAQLERERDQFKADLQAARVEREAQLQVVNLGGTLQAVADILTLRQKTFDVLEDGEPNVDGIRSSVEDVLNAHPGLRGGKVREQGSAADGSSGSPTGSLVDGIKARLKERFQRR